MANMKKLEFHREISFQPTITESLHQTYIARCLTFTQSIDGESGDVITLDKPLAWRCNTEDFAED